jgi:hypothetical protein
MGKRGPKATGDYSSKGATLSARITAAARRRLEESAISNGVSMSKELEARLSRSFEADIDGAYRDFGFNTDYWLLRLTAFAIKKSEEATGRLWRNDAFTFLVMVGAINSFLKAFLPPGEPAFPPKMLGLQLAPLPKDADPALVEQYRRHAEFVSNLKPADWGEMVASNILSRLQGEHRETLSRDDTAVFEQATIYLRNLLTEDENECRITPKRARARRRRISKTR